MRANGDRPGRRWYARRAFLSYLFLALSGWAFAQVRPAGAETTLLVFGVGSSDLPQADGRVVSLGGCEPLPLVQAPDASGELSPSAPLPAGEFQAFAREVLGAGPRGACSDSKNPRTQFLADRELLSTHVHLARERGLQPEACEARNWRIVALLLDDCGEPSSARGRAGSCGPELRLVAQPFVSKEIGRMSFDYSLHLIFDVADVAAFEKDRRSLHQLETTGGAASCDPEGSGLAEAVLARHGRIERLVRLGWSTSSRSGQQWSFGALERAADGGWKAVTLPAGGPFDNFSKLEMLRGRCSINSEQSAVARRAFGCPPAPGERGAGPRAEIERLQDPRRSERRENACVSCHMADQLELLHAARDPLVDPLGMTLFARKGELLGNQRQLGFHQKGDFWLATRVRRSLGKGSVHPLGRFGLRPGRIDAP